jgi:hypothetical protein
MRKRSSYRPKPIVGNPIGYVMEGIAVTPERELDQLRARELSAIDAFARGAAQESDWYEICAMLDICQTMATHGVGPEAIEACERAKQHQAEDLARFASTGRMGTTGPGLQSFREVYEFSDLQRQSIPRKEYEQHLRRVINGIKFNRPKTVKPPRT